MSIARVIAASTLTLLVSLVLAEGEQQFAAIGDLKLQSGTVLRDCRVGYRTFGTLDAARDNAVLFPTWFLGTTADLAHSFGSHGVVDSAKYYVIAVDALSNGISTSPSNSRTQGEAAFPDITIRDMVESQHRMLLGLGIPHLKAVVGISMGGMQTFQWITAYPDFMDNAVPIVGSPQPTSYDLMFYTGGLKAIKEAIAKPAARAAIIRTYADFFWLALNTPTYYVRTVKREQAVDSLVGFEKALLAWDPYNMAAGLRALCVNDAFRPYGEPAATSRVRAKLLVVAATQDHCVNPAPALALAKALGAQTLILDGDQGHSSSGDPRVGPAIDRFLGGN